MDPRGHLNTPRWISGLVAFLVSANVVQADVQENPWYRDGRQAVAAAKAGSSSQSPAQNVILFVGDGMGLSTINAARILGGQLRGESGEEEEQRRGGTGRGTSGGSSVH